MALARRRRGRAAAALVLCLALAAGCGECGLRGGPPAVAGPNPYLRCLAAQPPAPRSFTSFGRRFAVRDHELSLEGLPRPLRIAAFGGPGPGPAPGPAVGAALAAARPDLVLLLGGVGDTAELATATVRLLAAAPAPSLVLAGGRDAPAALEAALAAVKDARDRVLPISSLHRVRLGNDTLVPIAGAPRGAYARHARACGYGLSDLQARAGALGHPGPDERRFVVAWHAPGRGGPHGVSHTAAGLELGDDQLAEFQARIGAPGGIFAWPAVRPPALVSSATGGVVAPGTAASDGRIVVSSLGAPQALADGGFLRPGLTLLQLDAGGLSLLERVPVTAARRRAVPEARDAGIPMPD